VLQWLIVVVPALISTAGALVSVVFSGRAARAERLYAAEELATRFREPLLQAAFNLETRIYNIVKLDFFGSFLGADSTESEKEYAIFNTMYVFAQYFCWLEILRRESQFIDPRNDQRNHAVVAGLEAVRDAFADSTRERCFRLFRGEQRALGEVMLIPVEKPRPGDPRWECQGYASFVHLLEDEQMERWFRTLRKDIEEVSTDVANRDGRLRLIQQRLIDVIDIVDPDSRRVPSSLRKRLQ
jgi:hypothetical protein